MEQWTGAESGILRKSGFKQTHEDLLVFGYACKLFRDDEKALHIDQGKHLIPWMGDENLKIDRYDCRGALPDLRKYEASKEGYDTMRWLGLNDKERHIEELCDRERYYSLEINEEEEEMYKDEEEKRQKTTAIPFSYDVPQNPDNKEDIPTVEQEEIEEPYVPPPILDVPVDIEIPKTVKENARIEKTALFVCRQGPQMEILIKAKQGDNPQFSFLNQNDKLYKFYRHVLAAFKNGRYQGYQTLNELKTEKAEELQDCDSRNTIMQSSLIIPANQRDASSLLEVSQVTYQQSAKCAYSQLVNRIQGTHAESVETPKQSTVDETFARMTYEQQQQYYQYYYIQQYYEYYKQLALYQQGEAGDPGQFIPSADFQNLDPNIQAYIQQIAYNQYMQQQQLQQQQMTTNSYAQIVSNVNRDGNPYSANVPQIPSYALQENSVSKQQVPVTKEETVIVESDAKTKIVINKPLLSLAADYGSDSENDSDDSNENQEETEKEVYKIPTGDIQVVIDKMASYVYKNGEQFEDIVKAKGDPRFDFLNDGHEFNKYYQKKIRELKGDNKELEDKESSKEVKQTKKEKKIIAPVSFSIKKAKEEQPKEIKSALPVEESDEENIENNAESPTTVSAQPPSLVAVLMKYTENQTSVKKSPDVIEVNKDDTKNSASKSEIKINESNTKVGVLDSDDPLLEMMELTTECKKDSKRAEDKIKDKLAAAAREKLASISRDRALQLERKKKAAAFLKLKSEESNLQNTVKSEKDKSRISPARRNSVEIIIDVTSTWDKSKSRERDKGRSTLKEEIKERIEPRIKESYKDKSGFEETKDEVRKSRSRSKEKRKKEKDRKKSHKRKHSKHKASKKSKKRHKKSDSDNSYGSDSS